MDRTSGLALLAGRLALADAGLLERDRRPAAEIGCAYGTTLGCLEAMGIFWNKIKTSNPKFAQPLPFTHGYANSPSSLLCIEYALRGPSATFSGERLAGIEALLFAFDQLRAGAGDIILAGASESLTPAAYNHLLATGQLSRSGNWEDGIVPGEGAAMLVLESSASAQQRKAKVYAEVEAVELQPSSVGQSSGLPHNAGHPEDCPTPEDTVLFVQAGQAGKSALQVFSTELYCGDSLSVSPVLAATVAAGLLGGKHSLAALPFSERSSAPTAPRRAVVLHGEAGENLGMIRLATAQLGTADERR